MTSRRTFLTAVGAIAGIAATGACGPGAQSPAPGAGTTKSVTHPYGTSQVPVSPKRVVALDPGQALQVALEHRIPVVASATLDAKPAVPPYLPAPVQPFEHLGFGQVDIEKLATFGPDLIIGNTASLQDKYPAVAGLAPTVAYANTRDKVEWYDAALTVADVLGVRAAEQRKLDEYRSRASDFRNRNARALGAKKVVLLRFTTEELRIVTDSIIFPSRVLTDAGVQRTPSSAPAKAGETYTKLSPEQVGVLADADVIIHFSGGGAFDSGQATSTFTKYTNGDLWKRLPAVQAGKAFEVPRTSWWDGGSTSAADAILADLERIAPSLT